ncbi:MAG: metallophosphoesterase [Bacteroidales bacterium]|nr:metallophosphoesterase [Bacteroidales bacterium]
MRSFVIFSILTLFILAMDLYGFRGLQHLLSPHIEGNRLFTLVFWGITLIMITALLWAGSQFQNMRDPSRFFGVMVVMGIFLMFYVPKLMFNVTQLLGDIAVVLTRLFNSNAEVGSLRNYFLIPGFVIGILLFIGFGMGMIWGRTHVKIFREKLEIAGLPESFEGIKIVQLSDFHLAGFHHHPDHIAQVVEKVNQLEPDLVLFTGDMVHNFSEEMDPFVDILGRLKAPLGKYAVLGNHDYGHYYNWDSSAEEETNLERVKDQIRAAGFDLLMNEHRTITLNGHSIELIGVENWGKPPFPQKGDLANALAGTDPGLVKILLSHDPSHWNIQVKGKESISLTLSGHTHGMQFGFEIGNFRWSPSRWTYEHWAGLYRENGQYLYVNRGLGYTGFPGRVGIRPEITLITLITLISE